METIAAIAQSVADFLGLPPEMGYLVLGAAAGLLLALLARRGREATEPTISVSFGLQKPDGLADAVGRTHTVTTTTMSQGVLIVDGQKQTIDGAVLDEATEMLKAGHKLDAIKRIREATQLSLAQAKSIVDSMETLARSKGV